VGKNPTGSNRGGHSVTVVTVVNAEAVGVMLVWQEHNTITLDSQGAIRRIWGLQFQAPRSWIEETLKAQMQEGATEIDGAQGGCRE